ncbi:MAG: zinc ribbon domain-containing protein [Gammaproteobacteria bacterium]|nr:zinc ribbon domain-containing protein [Gammaproteobacteria bacterium]
MPIYEYRCQDCSEISSVMQPASDHKQQIDCESCGGRAHAIISRTSMRLSLSSKVEKLDPKYDKLVDRAIANTPKADPDFYLKRMKTPKDPDR